MSANFSRGLIGSGKKARKINKKKIVIFHKGSVPKRLTENNIEQLIRERKIAVRSPYNMKHTVQRVKVDIGTCKVEEVTVFLRDV